MKILTLSFILLFILSTFSLQANNDPEKKTTQTLKDEASYAKLVVYRPWKYTAFLAPMRVFIDKKVKLSLPNNAKDTLYLAPGAYTLTRKTGDSWPERIQVQAGETYFIKIYPTLLGRQLEVVEPSLAYQELTFHSYRKRGRLQVKPVTRVRLD